MHVTITDECISCEKCVEICPEVFEMGASLAEVKVDPVPPELEASAREAAEECPVDVIVIEE
jgi:ferredoxin